MYERENDSFKHNILNLFKAKNIVENKLNLISKELDDINEISRINASEDLDFSAEELLKFKPSALFNKNAIKKLLQSN